VVIRVFVIDIGVLPFTRVKLTREKPQVNRIL
jgi:hypothetical protein